jgi:hypothetical protein
MSFLCPNGTIFRQIDLICDWWFKVDCNSAPEHYAESSEQLQRAQRLRQSKLRHVVRSEQGFGTSGEIFFRNDARPAESVQKPAAVDFPHQGRAFQPAANSKINKRMDNNVNNNEANKSGENLSASEILYSRRNGKTNKSKTGRAISGAEDELKSREIQDTAETSSFVKDKSTYTGYSYPQPDKGYDYPKSSGYQYLPPAQGYNYDTPRDGKKINLGETKSEKFASKIVLSDPQPFNTRAPEKSTVMIATTVASFGISSKSSAVTEKPQALKSTARGSTTYLSSLMESNEKQNAQVSLNRIQSDTSKEFKTTTQSYETKRANTYSTARKPNGKTKETPFYTPTIPTIQTTESITTPFTTTTPTPDVSTKPTHSEVVQHALEMMESLKELDAMEGVMQSGDTELYMGQRSGLEVPPSSDPSTLHSLALYFANGDINNTKRMIEGQNSGISTVLLSDKTVTKYEELFPHDSRSTTESIDKLQTVTSKSLPQQLDEDSLNDLETQNSRNPVFSAAGTPQLREIAQVFTHALSAYLQDPEQFRKILSEIRPTTPPPLSEINEIPRFPGDNEFVRQESAYNIPRATATTAKPEDEIFDYSDVTIQPKSTTIETTDESTTTEANLIVTTTYPETLPPASSSFADKTPASRIVTENAEKNSRGSKKFEDFNTSADEINTGLDEGTNYFPEKTGSKSSLGPYGLGVKHENSTPIHDLLDSTNTEAIPLRWGEDLTTVEPITEQYPTVYSDLLPPYDINGTEVHVPPSNDLQIPFNEEKDESLHQAQSQSIVASRNNLYTNNKSSKSYNLYNSVSEDSSATTKFGERVQTTTELPAETTSIKGHFITKDFQQQATTTLESDILTTDYPTTTIESVKTTISDDTKSSIFLDPLTINDGLMESNEDEEDSTKSSPNTYLPGDSKEQDEQQQSTSTFASTQRRGKSSFATTPLTIRFAGEEVNSNNNNSSSNNSNVEPMQKRANEMFGNLNETQVNHLMNVMKKADENKTVKRLILLLIQTCDGDDHNKTLEDSRNALLNALIGMDNPDENQNQIKIVKTRREKSLKTTLASTTTTTTTTTEIPITTYKSPQHEKYTSSETGEDQDTTTTELPPRIDRQQADIVDDEDSQHHEYPAQVEVLQVDTTSTTQAPTTTSTTTTAKIITEDSLFVAAANSRGKTLADQIPKFKLKSNLKSNTGVRYQKSLGTSIDSLSESGSQQDHKNADTRALELLRSLYSLASRWG